MGWSVPSPPTHSSTKHPACNFHNRTMHLDITEVLLPTDAQENCFKRSIKIYIKTAPTCFGVITNIRERIIYELCLFIQLRTAAFKAYCAIWVRRSNFHHQASPRVTTWEHPAAEGGTVGEKCPVILPKCRLTRYT